MPSAWLQALAMRYVIRSQSFFPFVMSFGLSLLHKCNTEKTYYSLKCLHQEHLPKSTKALCVPRPESTSSVVWTSLCPSGPEHVALPNAGLIIERFSSAPNFV
jgi:hypothetical protein